MAALADQYAVADTARLRAGGACRTDDHAEADRVADGDADEAEPDGDRRALTAADADESDVAAGAAGEVRVMTESGPECRTSISYPGVVLEAPEMEAGLFERVEWLESTLSAVMTQLAALEQRMEAIDGESGETEI